KELLGADIHFPYRGSGSLQCELKPILVFPQQCFKMLSLGKIAQDERTQLVLQCFHLREGHLYWQKFSVGAPSLQYINGSKGLISKDLIDQVTRWPLCQRAV